MQTRTLDHYRPVPRRMSSQSVRILNVTHVLPAGASAAAPPHAGGGVSDGDVIKLSFLDTMFLALTPIKRLFFYEGGPDDLPPFPDLVLSLQSSLAAALAVFTSLAGKLAYRPSHDDVVIDCSVAAVSPGVMFIEAEYDDDDDAAGAVIDMRRLAGDDEHHTETFKRLVPEMEVGRLPAPLLAVQVTRPAAAAGSGGGGGVVAVGVSIHHVVGDGLAVWQFMRAWSTASRKGSPAPAATIPVVFDRKPVLRHPKDEEIARVFLRVFAPTLPSVVCSTFPEPDVTRQWRKTYLLRPHQIQSLKQQMLALSEHAKTKEQLMAAPSTYVAVLSLYWTSLVRSKFTTSGGDAYFMIPGDLRRRLRPPVDDGYFGNCVKPCYTSAAVGDLCGGDGLVHAAVAFQNAIRECLECDDPLADVERWSELERKVPKERIAQASASHRFMAYETDFGWGAPRRVELVSVYRMDVVTLVAAPAAGGGGGVQVTVALDRAHMEAFESNFLQNSDTKSDSPSI